MSQDNELHDNNQGNELNDNTDNHSEIKSTSDNNHLGSTSGHDSFDGGISGDHTFDGGAGDDDVDYHRSAHSVAVNLRTGKANSGGSNDSLTSIENVTGSQFDDNLTGNSQDNHLDGGDGNDTMDFDCNKSAMTGIGRASDGTLMIKSADGTDTLLSIENLRFLDGSLTISELIAQYTPGVLFSSSASDGTSSYLLPTKYKGPVTFLDYELLGKSTGDVITGSTTNDFMNLLDGDDAANGGAGDDVLDGGIGSNFLTGGTGNDTIFLDGRSGASTWSTMTDFSAGDHINIWGWKAGISKQVMALENQGADGYKGATFHYDLNNDGQIDTSITLTGLAISQTPTGVSQDVSGNGYLLIG